MKRQGRVLKFGYPFERIEEAERLCKVLDENKIEYTFYKSDGYWKHEFYVERSGKTWNEVMKIINSVYAPIYKFESYTQEV